MKPIKHKGNTLGCHGSCCLKVDDLTVTMGEDRILDHVSFHMHCGELIALIGPNGAGKSSLFRSILGQMPYTGSIQFQTAAGNRMHPRIGYVPQSPSFDLSDPVSVLESVRGVHLQLAHRAAHPQGAEGFCRSVPGAGERAGAAAQAGGGAVRRGAAAGAAGHGAGAGAQHPHFGRAHVRRGHGRGTAAAGAAGRESAPVTICPFSSPPTISTPCTRWTRSSC